MRLRTGCHSLTLPLRDGNHAPDFTAAAMAIRAQSAFFLFT